MFLERIETACNNAWNAAEPVLPFLLVPTVLAGLDVLQILDRRELVKVHSICCRHLNGTCSTDSFAAIYNMSRMHICEKWLPAQFIQNTVAISIISSLEAVAIVGSISFFAHKVVKKLRTLPHQGYDALP